MSTQTATIPSNSQRSSKTSQKNKLVELASTLPQAKYRKGMQVLLHNPHDRLSFLRGTIAAVVPSETGWRYRIKVGTPDVMWAAMYQGDVVERLVEIPELSVVTELGKKEVSWF